MFEFFMNDDDEGRVMRKYEKCFIKVCVEVIILINNFVEFIIVREKLDLKKIFIISNYFSFLV